MTTAARKPVRSQQRRRAQKPSYLTGDAVYEFRVRHELRQPDLADLLGRSRTTISAWERDEAPVPKEVAIVLTLLDKHGLEPARNCKPIS